MLFDKQRIVDQIRELDDLIHLISVVADTHNIGYTSYDHYLDVLKERRNDLELILDSL